MVYVLRGLSSILKNKINAKQLLIFQLEKIKIATAK